MTTEHAPAPYAGKFNEVKQEEWNLIQRRRALHGRSADEPLSGVSLSGGGIRSAAFALGVMRALHDGSHFDRVDYLSTVSGGGFTGSFISWLRRSKRELPVGKAELVPASALHYVRQNADYLHPAPSEERRKHPGFVPKGDTLAGVVLGQTFLSLAVYGALLVGLFFLLTIGDSLLALIKPVLLLASRSKLWLSVVGSLNFAILASLAVLSLGAVRVLWTVLARALRRAWAAIAPNSIPPSRMSAWRGGLWLLLGLVAGALAVAALFMFGDMTGDWLAGAAALLFGGISVLSVKHCKRHWDAPAQTVRGTRGAQPNSAWLILPTLAGLLVMAVLTSGLYYYLFSSGDVPAGDPPHLSSSGGLLATLMAAVWLAWALPHVLRNMGRFLSNLSRPLEVDAEYERSLMFQHESGNTMTWATIWLVLGSVPKVLHRIELGLHSRWLDLWLLSGALLLGLLWIARSATRSHSEVRARTAPTKSSTWAKLGWLLVLYGWLCLMHGWTSTLLDSAWPSAIFLVLGVGLVLGALAALNFAGPGHIYRDRLAETFLPDARAMRDNRWRPAFEASRFALSELANDEDDGPYHLLNASITTTGSVTSKYRHRGADSFVLSPLFCGSASTGWARTESWLKRPLMLRSAMGISAASIAPGTGLDTKGAARSPLVAAILGLLNLRLSYWADNPNPKHCPEASRWDPNLISPGLLRGVFRIGVSETGRHVELTDGADFDNLGLYELLRRRVELIVVSDASEDPDCTCSELGIALLRAREDLGVQIELAPDEVFGARATEEGDGPARGVAARGFAVGTIRYPDSGPPGRLLYLKPALAPDLEVSVRSFAAAHPQFPNDPTAEQSFDEDQFLAYEQLGYAICASGLDHLHHVETTDASSSSKRESTFRLKGEVPPETQTG
ncbi:MAG: patatin-like phospholipase family protein [Polyangiales bacterium]